MPLTRQLVDIEASKDRDRTALSEDQAPILRS